jgi:hypothetical protein
MVLMPVGDHVGPVELIQALGAQSVIGTATAAQTPIQAKHLITAAAHHVEVMGDLQHRPAFLTPQVEQQLLELLIGGGIQARLGLIQHQQLAGAHHTKRQENPLELTA